MSGRRARRERCGLRASVLRLTRLALGGDTAAGLVPPECRAGRGAPGTRDRVEGIRAHHSHAREAHGLRAKLRPVHTS